MNTSQARLDRSVAAKPLLSENSLRPKRGDCISVGSVQGVVSRISERDVVVETDERKLLVSKGENLLEGHELPVNDI